jgi:hypothetical protein
VAASEAVSTTATAPVGADELRTWDDAPYRAILRSGRGGWRATSSDLADSMGLNQGWTEARTIIAMKGDGEASSLRMLPIWFTSIGDVPVLERSIEKYADMLRDQLGVLKKKSMTRVRVEYELRIG